MSQLIKLLTFKHDNLSFSAGIYMVEAKSTQIDYIIRINLMLILELSNS